MEVWYGVGGRGVCVWCVVAVRGAQRAAHVVRHAEQNPCVNSERLPFYI